MQVKLVKVTLEFIDIDTGDRMNATISEDTSWGWSLNGKLMMFPRMLELLSTISEYLYKEKR